MLVAAQSCSCGCLWPQHELQCPGLVPHGFCGGFRLLMVPLSAACGCSAVAGVVVTLCAHNARSLASSMHQSVALRCARGRPLMLRCNCGLCLSLERRPRVPCARDFEGVCRRAWRPWWRWEATHAQRALPAVVWCFSLLVVPLLGAANWTFGLFGIWAGQFGLERDRPARTYSLRGSGVRADPAAGLIRLVHRPVGRT